ncbi:MAG: GNAT superfamily N-acetyltransferase [Pirellulaceae bacterium]|jgi:GNAT superfamily N-acetyltransferase
MTEHKFQIRPAECDDWETIVLFNQLLAAETEDKQLDAKILGPGVQALLADAAKGRYFVACADDQIIGQLMHTFEWSDWRNGDIWWLQSVYVHKDYRQQGIFRGLFEHVHKLAQVAPQVVGIRLYVENENARAQTVYNDLGFEHGGYAVMERLFG